MVNVGFLFAGKFVLLLDFRHTVILCVIIKKLSLILIWEEFIALYYEYFAYQEVETLQFLVWSVQWM